MRPLRILTLAFLLFTLTAAAQTDRRIEEQKRVIAALEKRIATEEQEISKIQKGRTATEERVRRLARRLIRATSCSTRPKSRRASCAERSPARTAWPGTFRQSSNATARSTAKWYAKPTATTSTTTT